MRLSGLKRRLLATSCVIFASSYFIAPVSAQQPSAETQAQIEELVVRARPIRDSQAEALRQKQEADNVVDIIAADTIGRFPDQNLADSLGRIPGLAIERDQGQARFINFRGAPFRYTSIAFDGIDVPGAEGGRVPRFDSFPSVITSAIAVNKAVTPDMPGEAVAGFIDIQTFSPFQYEGLNVALEGGYGNQNLGDVAIEKYNGRMSYSNDKVGALAFYSFNKRGRITDNREFDLEIDPASNAVLMNSVDFRSYRGDRRDESYGGTLEFRPADDVQLFIRTLYSAFIDLEERNQFVFDFRPDITGIPLTPNTGYQPVVLVQRLLEDGKYKNSTWTTTAGGEFMSGDWTFTLQGNYTKTTNDSNLPIPLSAGATVAASYDITEIEKPVLNIFSTGTMTPTDVNLLTYPANLLLRVDIALDIEAWKFKFDAERETNLFGDTTFKAGVQADFRDAKGATFAANIGGFPAGVNINDFVTDKLWDTDFNNSIMGRNIDNLGLRDAFEAVTGPLTPSYADDLIVGIDEKIYAGYAMATTRFDWGNIVYGVRMEATNFSTTGNQVVGGVTTPVDFSNNYFNVLPGVHVNVDLDDDLKFRVSATTGVSRPTYEELRASSRVNVINNEINGGNPFLKAEKSYGADASLEWYFSEASIASIGAYYRAIDNVIYADTTVVPDGSLYAPGIIGPNTPTTFNSFFNGQDGEILGLELNFIGQAEFLPYPFDGFGVAGNVTLLDSSFKAPTRPQGKFNLPGTSDVIYNASLFYENFGLSVRLNYQYRDDWLSTTENDSLTEYWAPEDRLDLSVRYTLPLDTGDAKFTLFADANNLTNSVDVRYVNTRRTPNQVEGFGARYVAGLRIDY
ncbi:MAG: TonB-dependent receptor [Rhodobacteraceae bacterium]|nr:TonB-dependent receptor [Paracoccaceae bacterium]